MHNSMCLWLVLALEFRLPPEAFPSIALAHSDGLEPGAHDRIIAAILAQACDYCRTPAAFAAGSPDA
jgi:hypothetical protein